MMRVGSVLLAVVCVAVCATPREALMEPSILSDSVSNTSAGFTRGDSQLNLKTQMSAPDDGNQDASTPRAGTDASDPPSADTLQLITNSTAAPEDDVGPSDSPTAGSSGDSLGGSAGGQTASGADRPRTEEVSALPSFQEVGTEATMSSDDLPLIFEPFEDVTPPVGSVPLSQPSVAMVPTGVTVGDTELEQIVSMATERTSSDARASGMLDWQTSGAPGSRAAITQSDPPEGTNSDHVTQQTLTVVHSPAVRPKADAEDLESREEADEEEEDEEIDSDEEEEEESEEDLPEGTVTPHTRPQFSLIPPPPVWVQRNQGLVRSWVELIREKAGYVSGMLAPVGIGIAGALLLVGALYSIRLIHRKRRDSFKHQRRKPPREVRSGPDNAMLLADSSEDEF